jgi:hypothetical protein
MNCLCSTCKLTLIPGGWSAIRKYSKMGTVRISTPEVGQCSGILIGPQRRDTETLARLSVLIRESTSNGIPVSIPRSAF